MHTVSDASEKDKLDQNNNDYHLIYNSKLYTEREHFYSFYFSPFIFILHSWPKLFTKDNFFGNP